MTIEIERKFSTSGDFLSEAVNSIHIVQGYICSQPGCTARIHIREKERLPTTRGASNEKDLSRYESGQKIPLVDVERLLELCEPDMIDKVCYLIPRGSHTWGAGVFHGTNEGLILTETELSSEDGPFEKPTWLGKEVSGDRRYYDPTLTKHPFNSSDA